MLVEFCRAAVRRVLLGYQIIALAVVAAHVDAFNHSWRLVFLSFDSPRFSQANSFGCKFLHEMPRLELYQDIVTIVGFLLNGLFW